MNDRVALLVIHGMGSQKPYETLDQFARGVESSLTSAAAGGYRHELRFRQHDEDPAHQQQAWTQVYARLAPADPSAAAAASRPALIDVAEYYWAPIINDRVNALESLRFLIRSALSPFQYLRANALVIDQVSDESPFLIIIRELARSCFIFFPFILLFTGVYALLAQPLLQMLANALGHKAPSNWIPYFWACADAGWVQFFVLTLVAFRWLLILMALLYFVDAVRHAAPPAHARKNVHLCDLVVLAFLLCLFAVPFFWDSVYGALPNLPFLAHAPAVHNPPSDSPSWFAVLGHFAHRYVAFAPVCLRLINLMGYLLLAALIYGIRKFLTTAIGGLAVYLGSDNLNKNFVARAQILSECTAAVAGLLAQHADIPAAPGALSQYDRVILVAHSLGTVIAYDTLNDLRVKNAADFDQRQVSRGQPPSAPNLRRITGLFSFGCPLNKVYYFFRARTDEKTTILNQVLYSLHNFRLRVAPPVETLPPEPPGNKPFCDSFRWMNVWCRLDMISGPMIFYRADQDKRVHQGFEPATAHIGYWANPKLYTYFSELL
jgi:hypothetical protein